MVDDVEKRWHDPGMFRHAARYAIAVLVIAALVFALVAQWAHRREPCRSAASAYCDGTSQAAILGGPGLVLLVGTLGAFLATYRAWRRRAAWPIWQGAGWFLLTVTIAYLAIGGGVLTG